MLGSAVDTWATVGVAIGTLATVVYALFRDVVVVPRRRPRLDLQIDERGSDYVRLRLANRPGKDTADDVVVIVTELRRLDGSRPETLIGLPLMWSGTNPPLTVTSVHPGSERHIELVDDEAGELRFAFNPRPADGRDILEPGTYEVSVEIRARNADARRYVIPLSWDGTSLRVDSPH